MQQSYEQVSVDAVQTHPDNPRRGSVDAIRESIDASGFYGAIVVQRSTGFVLAGNHRLQAARAAGLTEVPAIFVDVDDTVARRILVADNRTSDLASYDDRGLADLLSSLADGAADVGDALTGTGFTGSDLDSLLAGLEPTEPDPGSEGGGASPPGASSVSYDLVFDDPAQLDRWYAFLRQLRKVYKGDTIAGRLMRVVDAWEPPADTE